ncbi:hypothetical protein V6N12_042556 [Hibiscus sabdariffa]|uniref:Uncharacterized protein n=1 Tax=Hibiscus sabdariffa TaxID=183260 RepID=A0ABR2EF50_9ROSI
MGNDQRSWDESRLKDIISNEEVKAIISIPIDGPSVKDSLIWAASRDGLILSDQDIVSSLRRNNIASFLRLVTP